MLSAAALQDKHLPTAFELVSPFSRQGQGGMDNQTRTGLIGQCGRSTGIPPHTAYLDGAER